MAGHQARRLVRRVRAHGKLGQYQTEYLLDGNNCTCEIIKSEADETAPPEGITAPGAESSLSLRIAVPNLAKENMRSKWLVLTAAAVLSACVEDPQGPTVPLVRASVVGTAPGPVLTFDDQMVELGRVIAGFAGIHRDTSTGEIIVRLGTPEYETRTPSERLADASPHVADMLPPSLRGAPLKYSPAEFSFERLKVWHDRIVSGLPWGSITLTDVDEVANRVLVGVKSSTDIENLRALAEGLGIPPSAIVIREIAEAPFDAAPVTARTASPGHLQAKVTPRIPGTQIQYNDFVAINCSMGLNVRRMTGPNFANDGYQYFITASHCSRAAGGFGAVTGMTMGQPNLANPIATEFGDPPLFTNATNKCLPSRA